MKWTSGDVNLCSDKVVFIHTEISGAAHFTRPVGDEMDFGRDGSNAYNFDSLAQFDAFFPPGDKALYGCLTKRIIAIFRCSMYASNMQYQYHTRALTLPRVSLIYIFYCTLSYITERFWQLQLYE
jgi:hypothetical protein